VLLMLSLSETTPMMRDMMGNPATKMSANPELAGTENERLDE